MDDKGFIFTVDAVLALIIVLILIGSLAYLSESGFTSSGQIRSSQDAQDTLETMAAYKNGPEGVTVLQNISNTLTVYNCSSTGIGEAGQVAGAYLNRTLGSAKYNFTEENQLNTTIVANANMEDANNTAVGVRSYDDYVFKLYIWD